MSNTHNSRSSQKRSSCN